MIEQLTTSILAIFEKLRQNSFYIDYVDNGLTTDEYNVRKYWKTKFEVCQIVGRTGFTEQVINDMCYYGLLKTNEKGIYYDMDAVKRFLKSSYFSEVIKNNNVVIRDKLLGKFKYSEIKG